MMNLKILRPKLVDETKWLFPKPSSFSLKYNFICKKKKGSKDKLNKKGGEGKTSSLHKPEIWIEESDEDTYFPPIPGVDGPWELANFPVGNLNKPDPRDPEEEAKYENMYLPTTNEIAAEFLYAKHPELLSEFEEEFDPEESD